MKNSLTAAALMSIILLSDCKKTPAVYHTPIDSFLVQNFNYKVGTYWIYKDSITTEEDSFFVSKNTFYSVASANSTNVSDEIMINISQYHSNSQTAQWQMYMSFSEIDIDYIGNIEIDYQPFILVPYKIGLFNYGEMDSAYVVSIGNNYAINSAIYNNVAYILHFNNVGTIFPKHSNTFYFNSDVGIVKMDLNQDVHNIWEIERYNIIK